MTYLTDMINTISDDILMYSIDVVNVNNVSDVIDVTMLLLIL